MSLMQICSFAWKKFYLRGRCSFPCIARTWKYNVDNLKSLTPDYWKGPECYFLRKMSALCLVSQSYWTVLYLLSGLSSKYSSFALWSNLAVQNYLVIWILLLQWPLFLTWPVFLRCPIGKKNHPPSIFQFTFFLTKISWTKIHVPH